MLNEKPLVSIITPVYNGSEFIERAIESVLAQDYPNIEYIVLDDGSTDNTQEIIAKYKDRLILSSHSNIGHARTLNKGWAMCRGQLLGYLNADDILLPNAITELVKLFQQNENAVVVFPNNDLIDPYDRVIKEKVCRPFDYTSLVVDQECYIGVGVLFKREIFEQLGGWKAELRLALDREYWMRAGLLGAFVMHEQVLGKFRMHEKAKSYSLLDEAAAEEYIWIIEDYYKNNNLPQHILDKKNLAFSKAYLVSSRMHLRAGRIKSAIRRFKTALEYDPQMPRISVAIMMARTLVSRFIHRVIWNMRQVFIRYSKVTVNKEKL